jgi:hypothetical protein
VTGRLSLRMALLVLALLGAVAGCGGESDPSEPAAAPSSVEWPAPDDPNALTREAGLEPGTKETLIHHVHAHLDVLVDGEAVLVPAGIGIEIDDPGVKRGTDPVAYGGIEECDEPCISPLHTHDESGVVHTESATEEDNTLGQFFTEWDVKLDESCVGEFCRPDDEIAIYVDGEPYEGDPREITLTDRKQIAIVIGDPPAEIPSTYDFSNA